MLEMLSFIDDICTKNDIPYWLDSGTLLGAVRHGGYIPWDDDTDIVIPKDHYKKFKNILLHNNPSHKYILQCHETDNHFFGSWDVLRDLGSEYISDSPLHNYRNYRGLQIDIFITDDNAIPLLARICEYYQWYFITRPLIKGHGKQLLGFIRTSHWILHHLLRPLSHFPAWLHIREEYTFKPNSRKSIKKKHIFPLLRMDFEGNQFNVPADTDNYLKTEFGNWEQIPPESERIQHDVEIRLHPYGILKQ